MDGSHLYQLGTPRKDCGAKAIENFHTWIKWPKAAGAIVLQVGHLPWKHMLFMW